MLNQKRILVTRPIEAAKKLAASLIQQNFMPVILPTMVIKNLDHDQYVHDAFSRANKIIFISRNAVKNVAQIASKDLAKFKGEILAIGQSTATELYDLGIQDVIYPTEKFNSEALLELPELNDIVDETIVIFAGEGGRDLLAHSLVDRGAHVEKISTYERQLPVYTEAEITTALDNLNCIISASSESLRNLVALVPEHLQAKLLSTPLLVISQNMLKIAHDAKFNNTILVAQNATDEAVLEALNQWE